MPKEDSPAKGKMPVFLGGEVSAEKLVFLARLEALRKRTGWSRAELGRQLGLGAGTVNKWMLPGGRLPSPLAMRRVEELERRLERLTPGRGSRGGEPA